MSLSITKKALMAATGAFLGLAMVAEAEVEHRYWQTQSTTTINENKIYTNFSDYSFGGRPFLTWKTPTNQSTVKYFDFDFYLTASSPTGCYEIFTSPVSGSRANTDTRIWAEENYPGSGVWKSVSDDNNGSLDRTSFARIWVTGMRGVMFRVTPYSSDYHNMDLNLHFIHRRENSQAACQVAGKPFLVATSGPAQFIGTN